MNDTFKRWTLMAAAGLLLMTVGCSSTVMGTRPDTEHAALEQIKTRDDALRAFGAPSNIVVEGDHRLYYFVSGLESGGGIGLGWIWWEVLFLGREHMVDDTLIVRVDRSNRVVSFEPLDAQHIRRSSIWPGD